MPKKKTSAALHAQVKVMVARSQDRKAQAFSKGAAVLLHGVADNGSLNKTAKTLGMAYSKAWTMIKKVEDVLGFKLINRYGARGSKLTEKGESFLKRYDAYESRVTSYAEKTFDEVFKDFKK